jgi:polyferredoxin
MFEEIVLLVLAWVIAVGLALAGVLAILIWQKNRTRKVMYLRLFIQLVALIGVFYLFTIAAWLLLVLALIFVITLFTGRLFCGWVCPFGFYMDIVSLLREKLKVRYRALPERLNRALHRLRYVFAAIVFALPFLVGAPEHGPLATINLLFFRGAYRPLNIFLGPLEPLVVPWKGALFNLNFVDWSLSYPYTRDLTFYINIPLVSSIIVYLFIALTLTGVFFFRRFWCRFCPTGISLAALNRFNAFKWAPVLHLHKVEEKCTKCGICKRVCPLQVTDVYEQRGGDIKTSMCMTCLRCVEMCPYEGCLKVQLAKKTVFESRNWLEPSIIE